MQRLLKALQKTAADKLLASTAPSITTDTQVPGLWTARAMTGPTRPQALFSSKPLHGETTLPRFRSGNIHR